MQAVAAKDGWALAPMVSARVALMRVATGLLQGLCLYALYRAATWPGTAPWPASQPYLFAPLLLICLLAPVLLISSLGHMKTAQAARWIGVALLIMAGLACHDIWRDSFDGGLRLLSRGKDGARYPSSILFLYGCAGFFIAHTLVQAAVQDGRRIATYNAYFELAWKLALQLLFSLLFVGVLWAILLLGAQLFMLVKLAFLKDVLGKSWCAIPVCCCAFSCAMHLTDVRPAIVRGIRTLLLVLMSWILPLTALLVAGFLASLPFTGLAPLWATRSATAVLLGADVVLVIFINAAFQNGDAGPGVARLLRLSARLAAVLLTPITAIAIYALCLRVAGHGWTTDRIIAACCLLVAACYASGYAWAACQRGAWLAPLARINVMASFLILAILLALFSPIADPARLSVDHQMARFAAGKSTAKDLDVNYLRFEGGRYGRAALQQLQAGAQGPDAALLRERAAHVLAMKTRWEDPTKKLVEPVDLAVNVKVLPAGAQLPPSFLRAPWAALPAKENWPTCLKQRGALCDAYNVGLDADGRPQVLLIGRNHYHQALLLLLAETPDGRWRRVGEFAHHLMDCPAFQRLLVAGNYAWAAPQGRDLILGGQRLRLEPDQSDTVKNCEGFDN